MGLFRQEYWSGLPCPPQGILSVQGTNPYLLRLLLRQAGSLPLAPSEKQREKPSLLPEAAPNRQVDGGV